MRDFVASRNFSSSWARRAARASATSRASAPGRAHPQDHDRERKRAVAVARAGLGSAHRALVRERPLYNEKYEEGFAQCNQVVRSRATTSRPATRRRLLVAKKDWQGVASTRSWSASRHAQRRQRVSSWPNGASRIHTSATSRPRRFDRYLEISRHFGPVCRAMFRLVVY